MNPHSEKFLSPERAKEAAKRNIENKIAILEHWLRDGVPFEVDLTSHFICDEHGNRIKVYTPKSLRSFNSWSCASYSTTFLETSPFAAIFRNGTDTLNKHPDLKDRARNLIFDVRKSEEDAINNRDTVPKLKGTIARLEIFIENQNKKIIQYQRDNIKLQREVVAITKRENGKFEELKKNYRILEQQNFEFNSEISKLTKQLKNIYPLREAVSERE